MTNYANPDVITRFNILVRSNEDTQLTITCKNSDNSLVNLTGALIQMDIKASQSPSSPVALSLSSTTTGIVIASDPTTGVFVLTISKAAAAGFTFVKGYFDIKLVLNSITKIIGEGQLDVTTGITV